MSQAELARQLGDGWRAPKVSRILNGHAILSLADMYSLLNICDLSLTKLAMLAKDDGLPQGIRDQVITDFLEEQLRTVRGESAGTGLEHPSIAGPPR